MKAIAKESKLWLAVGLLFLAGCGGSGGGGGSSPSLGISDSLSTTTLTPTTTTTVASVTTTTTAPVTIFPFRDALNAFIANGTTKNFSISLTATNNVGALVTCTGTGTLVLTGATTPVLFSGINTTTPALAATDTNTLNIIASPGCNAVTTTIVTTHFYDNNLVALGHEIIGVEYGVYTILPNVPVTVKVGDNFTYGDAGETLFTDRGIQTPIGANLQRFNIEPESVNTVIADLIFVEFDTLGNQLSTEHDRFRLGLTGALVPVSSDVQATDGTSISFVFNNTP